MRKTVKIIIATTIVALTFMAEGAAIAVGMMKNGISFELPTGVVFEVETEGHQFELIGE
jgi:hypothetical protein